MRRISSEVYYQPVKKKTGIEIKLYITEVLNQIESDTIRIFTDSIAHKLYEWTYNNPEGLRVNDSYNISLIITVCHLKRYTML